MPKSEKNASCRVYRVNKESVKKLRLKMEPRHCKKGCKNTKRAETSSVKAQIPIVRKKGKTQ